MNDLNGVAMSSQGPFEEATEKKEKGHAIPSLERFALRDHDTEQEKGFF